MDLYEVTVTPAGTGAVSVSLAAFTGSCDETDAVCTAGGTALSGFISQEIQEATVVPSSWPLIPAGLGPGDEFRLLAKTKNPLKPDSTSTDIADYNDYVQEQVRVPGDIISVQDYADSFRVLGSTARGERADQYKYYREWRRANLLVERITR